MTVQEVQRLVLAGVATIRHPVGLFSLVSLPIRRLSSDRLIEGIAIAAGLVFVLSSMARVGHDAEAFERHATLTADFERIRAIVQPGRSVFVALRSGGAGQWSNDHSMRRLGNDYLAGRNLTRDRSAYDFLISDQRIDVPALLTPENGQVFLYDSTEYSTLIDEMIAKSELIFRSDFDVYRSGNSLIYTRERCWGDIAARFSMGNTPVVGMPFAASLAPAIRADYISREPWQWERSSDTESWTNVSASHPQGISYEYTPTAADVGYHLRAHVHYIDGVGDRVKAITEPSKPVAPLPSPKRPSDDSDVDAMFFLHVFPVDVNDLPDHRKQYGFDTLGFDFDEYRIPFIDRCVAVRDLPDYDIASVRTGRYTEEGQRWMVEFDPEASERYATLPADFERIRAIVQPGRSVLVALRSGGAGLWSNDYSRLLVDYYLAGRNLTRDRSAYDFLISDQRIDGPALLTPENDQVFLYHGIEYSTLIDEMIAKSELIFLSDFDVYRSGNSLIYTRERCRGDDDGDVNARFFLHVFPVDVNDLPVYRKQYRFNALDFHFDEYRIPFIDRCVAVRDLPDYDIASVRTGQYTAEGQLWKAEFDAEAFERHATLPADFERIRAIVQPGRSVFVAMRIGGAGLWSNDDSRRLANDYLAGRNLTRDRSAYDFLISDQRIDGPALLTPENGQVFLYPGIEYSTLIDEMIARSELVFRSDFDVYRSGNSLIYTRERCWGDDDGDVNARFFLHIVPVDMNDLPVYRKQYGFDNLGFRFDEYRIPFIDRCVAVHDLPDYDIAGVSTGQYTEEGQQLWKAKFDFAP